MKALVKIFLILPLSMLIGSSVQAQVTPGIQDTATIRQQKEKQEAVREKTKGEAEAKNEVKPEVTAKAADKTKNQVQTRSNENTQVKKVASARPDMSKAKGARPGSIVRPAGSRLPKGVGRPGGAPGRGRH